ncbi:MAG: chromate resistance protein [Desulfobacterales bacterium]|nr:chromate resistance protein [Desulfobacterales bacterium]
MRWITRSHVHVDRVACPWLITRFIDSDAEFLFAPKSAVMAVADREGAIPFDAPGAALNHEGDLCSFDVIIRNYGLTDRALLRLAQIVNAADTDRLDNDPLAAGLGSHRRRLQPALSRRHPEHRAPVRGLRCALRLVPPGNGQRKTAELTTLQRATAARKRLVPLPCRRTPPSRCRAESCTFSVCSAAPSPCSGMVVLVGMGERMAERFLPVYLLALGGGAMSIGLMSGLDNLLSALYSFPGGYLSDRIGTKRALLVFNLIAMAGFVIVIVFPVWQAVIVGSVLFISWSSISLPATVGLIARVLPVGKAHHGGQHAFAGQPHPHGARPAAGRPVHRGLGRTRRRARGLRGRPGVRRHGHLSAAEIHRWAGQEQHVGRAFGDTARRRCGRSGGRCARRSKTCWSPISWCASASRSRMRLWSSGA